MLLGGDGTVTSQADRVGCSTDESKLVAPRRDDGLRSWCLCGKFCGFGCLSFVLLASTSGIEQKFVSLVFSENGFFDTAISLWFRASIYLFWSMGVAFF